MVSVVHVNVAAEALVTLLVCIVSVEMSVLLII